MVVLACFSSVFNQEHKACVLKPFLKESQLDPSNAAPWTINVSDFTVAGQKCQTVDDDSISSSCVSYHRGREQICSFVFRCCWMESNINSATVSEEKSGKKGKWEVRKKKPCVDFRC